MCVDINIFHLNINNLFKEIIVMIKEFINGFIFQGKAISEGSCVNFKFK